MGEESLESRRPGTRANEELAELRQRLAEADETLQAIRRGEVDAFVVTQGEREQVFTLATADRPFRVFVETMQQGAATLNAEGIVLYTNDRLAEMLDLPREKLLGLTLSERVPAAERPRFASLLRHGETGSAQGEIPLERSDGAVIPAYFTLSALPEGEATVCAVVTDLTEQKRHEALRESEARFRQLAESLPQLVWTCNPDGQCDYLSRQWVDYTGVVAEDQLGEGWLEVIHPDDVERARAGWAEAVAGGRPFDADFRIRGAAGDYRWFKARSVPIFDSDGALIKWFGTNTDLDDQKRAEAALREADARKDEFLAMLAHELRNPLAPILNAVEILRVTGGREQQLRFPLEVIQRQILQMGRLVDDLLDISRITRGTVRIERRRIQVSALIEQALETSRPLIDARGHDLVLSLPGEPIELEGDLTRLSQVVSNLLNNAAKYSGEAKKIWLSTERDGVEVVITVRDEGMGIAPEMLPRVFELFTQIEHGNGGLGVGLALVRSLVKLHGGTVSVRSAGRGAGSEFVVRLPALPVDTGAAEPKAAPRATMPGAARRVLVVDDNVDSASSLGMLLELAGHQVRVAHDGPEALEAAASFRPEVVLCDIGLPGMDGHEVARRLRDSQATGDALLVALTGYGSDEDRLRSREAGFDHHLVKPLDPDQLRKLLGSEA